MAECPCASQPIVLLIFLTVTTSVSVQRYSFVPSQSSLLISSPLPAGVRSSKPPPALHRMVMVCPTGTVFRDGRVIQSFASVVTAATLTCLTLRPIILARVSAVVAVGVTIWTGDGLRGIYLSFAPLQLV